MVKNNIKKNLELIYELNKISSFKKTMNKEIKLFYTIHSTIIKKKSITFKIKIIKNTLTNIDYSILIDIIHKKYELYDIKVNDYSNIITALIEYKKKVKNFKISECNNLLNDLKLQIQ